MKDKIIPVLMVFGLSMFCGIVAISIGLGSLFNGLYQVGGPFVCGSQQLKIEKNEYSYRPGEITTTITAYCVNPNTGAKLDVTSNLQDISLKLQIVTGILFGLIIFALAMAFLNWAARRLGKSFTEMFQPSNR